jgi:hypothetical protein
VDQGNLLIFDRIDVSGYTSRIIVTNGDDVLEQNTGRRAVPSSGVE